jgi:hypothetical protein
VRIHPLELDGGRDTIQLRETPGNLSGSGSETHQHLSPADATKENESSWIFEPRLTCTNALRRVQNPGFSLVIAASRCYLIQMLRSSLTCTNGCSCWSAGEENSPGFFLTMDALFRLS